MMNRYNSVQNLSYNFYSLHENSLARHPRPLEFFGDSKSCLINYTRASKSLLASGSKIFP